MIAHVGPSLRLVDDRPDDTRILADPPSDATLVIEVDDLALSADPGEAEVVQDAAPPERWPGEGACLAKGVSGDLG
ncbi:hypothetical protein ABZS52_31060 [Micromonospora profundi]|uniref:hypothetical protein n=1 Tax=Micromonospora profundi TaxID=1420889 RepID=UPI0033A0EE59